MRLAYGILLVLIIVLSLLPTEDAIPGGNLIFGFIAKILLGSADYADKITHVAAYAAITCVGMLGIIRPLGRWLFMPLAMLLLSGLLEFGQGAVAARTPDLMDFVANLVGVTGGAIVAGLLLAVAHQQTKRKPVTV
ncbi:hypothetical protein [Parvularcula sp. IMCC14364]|uniref:hypothetical protein n=1 Tax=Parvularcula sp. IMCC14364 TaxID=3067902 RepID=UPI002741E1B1|nr:hypothetical protein [Parvularcula sp. IMCC14364]